VASKAIEDLRLGSFTEKSTRYVVFDTGSFHDLPELSPPACRTYRSTCRELFATYLELFPIVEARLEALVPVDPAHKPKARSNALRAHACDLLRGLLPASTMTNLGVTANARALATLLTKMMSSPLQEVRALAAAMRDEARVVAPSLVRHVDHNPYRASLRDVLAAAAPKLLVEQGHDERLPVRVVRHDEDALERIALALLYDQRVEPHAGQRLEQLRRLTREQLTHLVREALRARGPFDAPPRAFEASSMLVELELDYGAYRDLQRHRMLAPFTQLLGCTLGASVPPELDVLGVGDSVRRAHDHAAQTWRSLHEAHPWQAQYVVPLAFRIRTLWSLSLRELFYVVELRSGKQGHASYRRIAQAMYRAACHVHPWLADVVRVDLNDYALARSG
jgi:thymidylate synthase ThyX